ncbi:MAG: large subunit ribosomal protein L6 [Patescibacteria group bacterium]
MLISIKMRKDLSRTIEIPAEVTLVVENGMITAKANGKELTKKFLNNKINIAVNGNEIVLNVSGASRRESKMIGTFWAHIKNMIKGVTEGFEYKMEVCNVHFPMNVKIQGNTVVIKSFLGETTQRVAKIADGVKVDIKGTQITITGNEIESAGQTAANIEKATRLTGRDRRIFQDGIFLTHKNGREI